MLKRVHHFKQGDIVHYMGARFRITSDARESQGHRPQAGHLTTAAGPCDTAWAIGEWIDGRIEQNYFGPLDTWTFQGNFNLGLYRVEAA